MFKFRHIIVALGIAMYSVGSPAEVNFSIGYSDENIGINLSTYPQLQVVPGYPVYYAPNVSGNYFFYDGMYWVYQQDNWYASSWYDGPWGLVEREYVPVYILRVPVRYYRQPPAYFRGWRADAPPRWGDHWGKEWNQQRSGWDNWDRHTTPPAAPPPRYQREYSGNRYPRQLEQQHELIQRNYRYEPRDPEVQKIYQSRDKGKDKQQDKGQARGQDKNQGRGEERGQGHD